MRLWFENKWYIGMVNQIEIYRDDGMSDNLFQYIYDPSIQKNNSILVPVTDVIWELKNNRIEAWRGIDIACNTDTLFGLREYFQTHKFWIEGVPQ